MSLACLVCHGVESPSRSFRSYSVSSTENEGRCSAIASCLTRKVSVLAHHHHHHHNNNNNITSSKVMPQPTLTSDIATTTNGPPPRLVRSRAVRRDLVRDWNFDEIVVEVT